MSEVSKQWGAPPLGRCLSPGVAVVSVRNIFILNEIWTQDKIRIYFGRHFRVKSNK
jgi:hypothetical protein